MPSEAPIEMGSGRLKWMLLRLASQIILNAPNFFRTKNMPTCSTGLQVNLTRPSRASLLTSSTYFPLCPTKTGSQ